VEAEEGITHRGLVSSNLKGQKKRKINRKKRKRMSEYPREEFT